MKKIFQTYSVKTLAERFTVRARKLSIGRNILDYTRHIMNTYPEIASQKIEIINTDIEILPYANWSQWNPPHTVRNLIDWWESYNLVKHNRQDNIPKASMKNVLNALVALYLIEIKYLQVITNGTQKPDEPESRSNFFTLKYWNFNLSIVDYLFNQAESQIH